MKDIEEQISIFFSTEDRVREHINTHRYQQVLIANLDNWSQICSSLDTLGDTGLAIKSYFSNVYPDEVGLSYIYTYGILQALFVQQDAMNHLSEAFDVPFEISDELKIIRKLRNASIGHPTKNREKQVTYFNHISRMSMNRDGFTLIRYYERGEVEFIEIELQRLVEKQLAGINDSYNAILKKLEENDINHRAKFMNTPLSDIFHSTMGYMFQKVGEAIYSPSKSNINFGLSQLESIKSTYNKFLEKLTERDELTDFTEYDLNLYFHCIERLKQYLQPSGSSELTELDARINLYYLRNSHDDFIKLAKEIDEDYI